MNKTSIENKTTYSGFEKFTISVTGVMIIAAGILSYISPAKYKQFIPQCTTKDCVEEISSDPTTTALALFTLGSLFILLALNGRRLSNFKLPGGFEANTIAIEAESAKEALQDKSSVIRETAEAIQSDPPEELKKTIPTTNIKIDGDEFGVFSLENTPTRLIMDILNDLKIKNNLPERLSIDFIARKIGKGNHPWFLKLKSDDMIFKISYGGQGKIAPTITTL
jgi:hypothetical protein